jgi:hypothetical protein
VGTEYEVVLWSVEDGTLLEGLPVPVKGVYQLGFSPDGRPAWPRQTRRARLGAIVGGGDRTVREEKTITMEGRKMILLEGNIGAGKSTMGRLLDESGLCAFIEEPVEAWQEGFAGNLLDAFYSDMQRWAFTFQITAFVTRAKTWQEVLARTDHSRVVLERSIFTDRYVFATNSYRLGGMTDLEWEVYCGLWDFLTSNYCVEPDCIL